MTRISFFLFLTLIVSACGAATPTADSQPESLPPAIVPTQAQKADLPDLGPAPELTNTVWLNVSAPLRLADLRGQVVLLDMWTFG